MDRVRAPQERRPTGCRFARPNPAAGQALPRQADTLCTQLTWEGGRTMKMTDSRGGVPAPRQRRPRARQPRNGTAIGCLVHRLVREIRLPIFPVFGELPRWLRPSADLSRERS